RQSRAPLQRDPCGRGRADAPGAEVRMNATHRISAKSPCRPRPDLKRLAPATPSRDQRFAPVVPLLDQRLAHAEPVTADSGAPIGAHANLREAGDVAGQLLRFLTRAALLREVFAQADLHALLRRHFSAGENDLQRATQADDARQTAAL